MEGKGLGVDVAREQIVALQVGAVHFSLRHLLVLIGTSPVLSLLPLALVVVVHHVARVFLKINDAHRSTQH